MRSLSDIYNDLEVPKPAIVAKNDLILLLQSPVHVNSEFYIGFQLTELPNGGYSIANTAVMFPGNDVIWEVVE